MIVSGEVERVEGARHEAGRPLVVVVPVITGMTAAERAYQERMRLLRTAVRWGAILLLLLWGGLWR